MFKQKLRINSPKDFLIAGCMFASSFAFISGTSASVTQKKKPNLLFIITDQQRYDALSLQGNKFLETPNLDRLAKQGAWFKNAYTPCAVCAPARSSILTGCTVEHTRVLTNEVAYSPQESGIMPMTTFDEILSNKGYWCEYYGKWHAPLFRARVYKNKVTIAGKDSEFGPGLQKHYQDELKKEVPSRELKEGEFRDTFSGRPYMPNPLDKRFILSKEGENPNVTVNQPDIHGCLSLPKEHTITALEAKETISAIERLKDSTFSITCSFHFPHAPMLPVEPYNSMFPQGKMESPVSISDKMTNSAYSSANKRLTLPEYSDPEKIKYMISNYFALVREIDDWVGQILNKLDALGLTENTFVVFTSDHGEMLGSHGMREKNVFYEESAHIPLIIRYPSGIKPGIVVENKVSTINLFATILDYTGAENHPSDGESLRNIINGKQRPQDDFVVTEWLYRGDTQPNFMIVKDNWKMFIPYSAESKVINSLYDLKSDPYEMKNLLGNNPDKEKYLNQVEMLRNELLSWLKSKKSQYHQGVKDRKLLN